MKKDFEKKLHEKINQNSHLNPNDFEDIFNFIYLIMTSYDEGDFDKAYKYYLNSQFLINNAMSISDFKSYMNQFF